MTDGKRHGSTPPQQNNDPRRTSNPPSGDAKRAPATEKTPKSSPDAAIAPEKLNAENDK
ncbi:MAG: hypothetical protein JOZ16_09375 [Methylobacteriaceae bacterium]|nr:hypothetical protein [Methylobacteriaceae bacterium]